MGSEQAAGERKLVRAEGKVGSVSEGKQAPAKQGLVRAKKQGSADQASSKKTSAQRKAKNEGELC